MEVVYLALIGLVVWYFGSSINAATQKAAELANQEFASFERDQRIRLHKVRANQTKKVKSLADVEVMSDKDFEEFFNIIKEEKNEES
jgi:hypothetical protein